MALMTISTGLYGNRAKAFLQYAVMRFLNEEVYTSDGYNRSTLKAVCKLKTENIWHRSFIPYDANGASAIKITDSGELQICIDRLSQCTYSAKSFLLALEDAILNMEEFFLCNGKDSLKIGKKIFSRNEICCIIDAAINGKSIDVSKHGISEKYAETHIFGIPRDPIIINAVTELKEELNRLDAKLESDIQALADEFDQNIKPIKEKYLAQCKTVRDCYAIQHKALKKQIAELEDGKMPAF